MRRCVVLFPYLLPPLLWYPDRFEEPSGRVDSVSSLLPTFLYRPAATSCYGGPLMVGYEISILEAKFLFSSAFVTYRVKVVAHLVKH